MSYSCVLANILNIDQYNITLVKLKYTFTVADPGFPIGGGMDLVWGAVDPRGSYVSKILHVKTKEFGPIGGACAGCPP